MALNYLVLIFVLLALSTEASQLYGWGDNSYGQLGVGNNSGSVVYDPTPISFYDGFDIVDLIASGTFHFAINSSGNVYVCGNNWYGALGLPLSTGIYQATPVENPNLKGCTVYLGKRHGNAVCSSNFVGWGVQEGYVAGISSGIYGKITQSLPSYELGSNIVNVTAGNGFSIVTLTNGSMIVAGNGAGGILGLGNTESQNTFVPFTGFSYDNIPLLQIFSSHADHVCGIDTGYNLYCWGTNTVGQLGIGNLVNQSRPALVTYFENEYYIVEVTTGLYHTLALTAGGKVFAWGLATSGVLGNGLSSNQSFTTPQEIEYLADKNIVQIFSGLNFNYARSSGNQWYSWGAGSSGVLGTLNANDVGTPKPVSFPYTINILETSSTSRTVFGWLTPNPPTTIVGPPVVNECANQTLYQVSCPVNSVCQDTDRGYTCVCAPGYSGTSASDCQDINECIETPPVCVAGATCTNLPGSFNCTCPTSAPVGNGLASGNGCSTLSTPAPSTPPTSTPTGSSGPSSSSGSPTSTPTSSPTGASSSQSTNSPTNSPSSTPAPGSGAGNGSETGAGSGSGSGSGTGSGSNTGSTTETDLYNTLHGAADDIQEPSGSGSGSSSSQPILLSNSNNSNHDKNVMIGVLVAFAVVMAIVIAVGAFFILRARRPPSDV